MQVAQFFKKFVDMVAYSSQALYAHKKVEDQPV